MTCSMQFASLLLLLILVLVLLLLIIIIEMFLQESLEFSSLLLLSDR